MKENAKKIEFATDRLVIRTPDEKDVHDIFNERLGNSGNHWIQTDELAKRGRRENPQGYE